MSLDIRGSLRPGQPITVSLTADARLQTEEVKTRLYLPEWAALRQGRHLPNQPNVTVLPVSERLPAAVAVDRSMSPGGQIDQSVTIRPEKPGFYMVSAAVWAPEADVLNEEGVPVDNGQSMERWIWISEDGGLVTDKFDPDLFPEGYHVTPGPLTPIDQPPALQPVGENRTASASSSAKADADDTEIKFTHFDPISGQVKPIAGVRVEVREKDEYGGGVEQYTRVTDDNGAIRFGCDPYGYESYQATLRAVGGGFTILDNVGSSIVADGSTVEAACGYTAEARASADQYFVWQEMKRVKGRSEAFYDGLSRPDVVVNLDSELEGAFYNSFYDEITLGQNIYETSNLSDFDVFIMAHEYGHAYHEKAIGGYATDGNCPEDHYLNGAYDLDCAFTEGYANFHGVIATADSNFYRFIIENTPGVYNYPASAENDNDDLSTDGSVIEATVAAFLYDLTDPKNENHDHQDLPGRYVADILGSCYGQANGGGFYEANGADHLVACFQHEEPPYDVSYDGGDNDFFQTRSFSLRADGFVGEDATEPTGWSPAAIDEIWRWTLYKTTP